MSSANDGVRASLFVTDYNVRDMFGCRQAPELELSDLLETVRAEGRVAGLEEAAREVEPFTLGQGTERTGALLARRIRALKEKNDVR